MKMNDALWCIVAAFLVGIFLGVKSEDSRALRTAVTLTWLVGLVVLLLLRYNCGG